MWSWRCKKEEIMLDEEEFFQVARPYLIGMVDKRERHYGPMKRESERITGPGQDPR